MDALAKKSIAYPASASERPAPRALVQPGPCCPAIRDIQDVPVRYRGGVVMIGNFDGFHRGHQALLDAARRAGAERRPLLALTPDPHPTHFFKPESDPFELSPGEMKLRLFAEAGLDAAALPCFDARFAGQSAEDFVQSILIGNLDAAHVVVGYDFRFGKGRQGNTSLLRAMMADHGRTVSVVEARAVDGTVCSSSRIRKAIARGQMDEAARLMGRNWQVAGIAALDRGPDGLVQARLPLGRFVRPAAGSYRVRVNTGDGDKSLQGPGQARLLPGGDALRITCDAQIPGHLPSLARLGVTFLGRG